MQYDRLIVFDDIERPSLLDDQEQLKLLNIINKYRSYFATNMQCMN